MSQTYANDADLVARFPETAAVDAALRGYALDDARAMIALDVFRAKALRAHCLLAAHYLAHRGSMSASATGPVQSWSAGEMSVTYATAAAEYGDPTLASTRYGQEFLTLTRAVPHEPIGVS